MRIGRKFKTMLVVMLSVMLVLSSIPSSVYAQAVPEAKPPAAFTDVQAGDWFSEAVEYVSRLNLMNGTSEADGSFSPGSSLTRAMLVTVLHRHAGSPVVEAPAQPFADVRESDWYAAAVNWANKAGIAKGTGGNRFSPNLPVTREQAAVFIHRYVLEVDVPWMEPSDEDGSISVEGAISEDMSFADEAGISEWASASVAWARRHGLFVSKPGNLFVPNAQMTRGEIAVLVYRFAEKVVAFAEELVPAQSPDTDDGTSNEESNSDTGSSTILVSYQTNGGAAIQPTRIKRGNRLAEVPVPQRDGYLFEGWFRNPTLTEVFYADAPFYSSTTLYAAYRERDYEYQEFVDPTLFLGECAADASFEIETRLALNTSNLSQHVMIKDLSTQTDSALPRVTALSGNRYTLSPNVPYEPGRTYELTLLDNDIIFTGRAPQVRTLAFTIEQLEKYEVSFEDTIAYLTWDQVTVQEEAGTYLIENSVMDAKGIAVGKTICLTDELENGVGVLNGDAKMRNVMDIVAIPGSSPPECNC